LVKTVKQCYGSGVLLMIAQRLSTPSTRPTGRRQLLIIFPSFSYSTAQGTCKQFCNLSFARVLGSPIETIRITFECSSFFRNSVFSQASSHNLSTQGCTNASILAGTLPVVQANL
jgi:hypothetical protein